MGQVALPGPYWTAHYPRMSAGLRHLSALDTLREASYDQADTVVGLTVSLPARVDLARVPAAFGDEARTWLGELAGTDAAGLQLYRCDLRLRVSPESRALFRKSAIVSLGVPRWSPEGWLVAIEWRAATLAPLFPVFVGRLTIGPERVAIDGYYAPPFGVVGYVLDRAVMSIVARGTARWFLTTVAAAVG
jgi:hypothetical protein